VASEDSLQEDATARWVGAFADLARTVFVPTDTQLRILHWPPAAEALLGWSAERTVGFGLPSVLSLARSTQIDLRAALDAAISDLTAARALLAALTPPMDEHLGGRPRQGHCRVRP
jgi:PAS domain-containing protein